jgi:hypothetical protein
MMVVMMRRRRKKTVTTTFSLKDSLKFEGEVTDKYRSVCWFWTVLEVDTSDRLQCSVMRPAFHLFYVTTYYLTRKNLR